MRLKKSSLGIVLLLRPPRVGGAWFCRGMCGCVCGGTIINININICVRQTHAHTHASAHTC